MYYTVLGKFVSIHITSYLSLPVQNNCKINFAFLSVTYKRLKKDRRVKFL